MFRQRRIKQAVLALVVALAVALSALAYGGSAATDSPSANEVAFGPCWLCGGS